MSDRFAMWWERAVAMLQRDIFCEKVLLCLEIVKMCVSLHLGNGDIRYRELSSAGSEHLPYKQRVGGSNPSAPTRLTKQKMSEMTSFLFL